MWLFIHKTRQLTLILLLCCLANASFGKHLVGGNILYTFKGLTPSGQNEYEITLELYRDCTSDTEFDPGNEVKVGVFRADNGSRAALVPMTMVAINVIPITSDDPCVPPPPNGSICYQKAVYKGFVNLTRSVSGYHIVWSRCCRNNTIANIVDPGETGMTLTAFIPNMFTTTNSSPVFNNSGNVLAPTYICLGDLFTYDFSATDPDGDSLTYTLVTPLRGGSTLDPLPDPEAPPHNPISWQFPYSLNNVMGGSPPMYVDNFTGMLSARPSNIGQFVFSIKVTEYRNGVRIADFQRDIQTNVINCPINFPPFVESVSPTPAFPDTLVFYAGEESCYDIIIKDQNGQGVPADILTVTATGDAFGGGTMPLPYATFTATTGLSPVVAKICWSPNCQTTTLSSFTITAQDNNNCPGPNIISRSFIIKSIRGNATPPDVRCVSVTSPNQLTVTWLNPTVNKLTGFDYYVLERNDGTGWVGIANITDSTITSYVDNGVSNTYTSSYCYRLATAKVCPVPFVGLPGKPACSMIVSANPVNSTQALIEWTPSNKVWSPTSYGVWVNSNGNESLITTLVNDTTYLWTGCNFDGFAKIRIQDPITGCQAWSGNSLNFTLNDISPAPVALCVASVTTEDNANVISWSKFMDDDFLHYQIFRSKTASANFIKIAEITDANIATYVDSDVNVDAEKYCYYVLQSDLCGNVSLSATHCTMNLKTSGLDYTINLNWNDYEGWTPDTHFLELWRTENGSPVSLVKSFSNNVINYQDLEVTNGIAVYCYKIKAVNNSTQSECKESWSNESCISFPPTLFFPNAFTPNGDGNNDRFTAVGLYGKSFSLSIYDRWGKLAFQTESQEMGWDGKIKGVDAPEGVYVFRARVVGYKDEVIQKTGTVTLVR